MTGRKESWQGCQATAAKPAGTLLQGSKASCRAGKLGKVEILWCALLLLDRRIQKSFICVFDDLIFLLLYNFREPGASPVWVRAPGRARLMKSYKACLFALNSYLVVALISIHPLFLGFTRKFA